MAVLARLARGRLSMQCDVCTPPVLTVAREGWLRRTGWQLRDDGAELDRCPRCRVESPASAPRYRGATDPARPDPARLPNLVVVGATKAGTSSMYDYLGKHPDVAVSRHKEMRFFTDPHGVRWLEDYQSAFPTDTRYRVEATPFYSKEPCFPGVAQRMAELIPDARILYLVRDPVERLVAEYVEQLQWHATDWSLEEELHDLEEHDNPLVASSRYGTQAAEYLRRFPAEQVAVVDLAELARDPSGEMDRLYAWLGLRPLALPAAAYEPHNVGEGRRALPAWWLRLRGGPVARVTAALPTSLRQRAGHAVWRLTGRPLERPELDADTETRLRRVLRPEVEQLRDLTGQSFATWSL
jgi:hypothetical protein